MRCAVVLFTRDLRVHDHPALAAAAREAEAVVPLFVLDDGILGSAYAAPNRVGFLLESLADLDASLGALGARLVVRRGDVVRETERVVRETGAEAVLASADVSAYARERERRLAEAVPLRLEPGVTVVPPRALQPQSDADHYRVFSPYFRAWLEEPLREPEAVPAALRLPEGLDPGRLPALDELVAGDRSPEPAPGGETAGRERADAWLAGGLSGYAERHRLDRDPSRLSPYLHFGCVSPLELVLRARERGGRGSGGWVREVAWRDFYAQLLLANPETPREDLRPRGDVWENDEADLEAWRGGRTGYPVVDAGMRQLAREGWMHNRARLITASFLVKHLLVDWRVGARHFFDLLLDGDVASNVGNWQWVAGTGVDARPHRVYNPLLQAKRHDPDGAYVRRHVPELAELEAPEVHDPPPDVRRSLGYPEPIVEHAAAVARFRARRAEGAEQLRLAT